MVEMMPVLLLVFLLGALMCVPLIDLSVTSGDHLSLNVRPPNEQLCHRSSVAVLSDPSDSNLFAYH